MESGQSPAASQLQQHLRIATGVQKHRSRDTTYVRRTPLSFLHS